PSDKLIVIGVTGTNGKSSTVQFIGRILEHAGKKVAWTTTAGFKIADKEWENKKKMTMLGRFQTQKMLRDIVRAGCTHAIIETSSEGIKQHRHVGVDYDVAVFTNLTPEHIESHGGFENYKKAKGKLFKVAKKAVVNVDDEHAEYYAGLCVGETIGYSLTPSNSPLKRGRIELLVAQDLKLTTQGASFKIENKEFDFSLIGKFQAYNILCAIATARILDLDWEIIQDAVARMESLPGRLERIDEGQDFSVIVDYAYEPAALAAVYDAIDLLDHERLIHIVGSAGGGRDKSRRTVLGTMSAKHDDVVIVANEDPYDDDPMEIINNVADAAKKAGKIDEYNLFRILDRSEAIKTAIGMAKPGDLVLITGKGNEPVMAVANNKKIPWDDRKVAREVLKSM
ncbi:MAG: UDP-N-acetylmuramoyl-L-alanyl-D-glutamate--2,6-diaminopimelate ligase, partial [Patescibacteria group bacterium]